jgi:hypothetical protein
VPLPQSIITKLRFYSTIIVLYGITCLFIGYVARPLSPLDKSRAVAITEKIQAPRLPSDSISPVISGLPNRLVIPGSSIDLPLHAGYYDSATNSWTLSGYYAQFAMISTLANNLAGQTFIYGHNNDFVFGALRHQTPNVGAIAYVYTTDGHIFEYSFSNATSLGPNDTSVLQYAGPPQLLIQTCTGSLNEWRTEYSFSFVKVVQ